MEYTLLKGFLLLFFLSAAYTASTQKDTAQTPLQCYVCTDCASVNKDTPVEDCNAEFFITKPTTMASSESTTDMITTELELDSSTTEESTSTTTESPSSSSSSSSTTEEDIPSTTEEDTTSTTDEDTTVKATFIPTPPTIGPEATTTAMPTPPNPGGVVMPVDIVVEQTPAPQVLQRQQRQALVNGFTYHCYTVQANINNSLVTDRGCSRVATEESVCGQLEEQNAGTTLSKCTPCSMNLCNTSSSSALGVSLLAFVASILTALLRSN